jgi:hypothetical protein
MLSDTHGSGEQIIFICLFNPPFRHPNYVETVPILQCCRPLSRAILQCGGSLAIWADCHISLWLDSHQMARLPQHCNMAHDSGPPYCNMVTFLGGEDIVWVPIEKHRALVHKRGACMPLESPASKCIHIE